MRFLDMHAHVLPNVDDGAKDLDAALALLRAQQAQGVDAVAATPHFYAAQVRLESYLQTTRARYEQLREVCRAQALPELFLGYEVLYFRHMASSGVLPQLTLGGSRYLLLELPYRVELDETVVEEIVSIRLNCDLIPILAHLERFASQDGFSQILGLIDEGYAEAQINAASLLQWGSRNLCLRLWNNGYIRYLASDAHSMKHRPPALQQAMQTLEKKAGKDCVEAFAENSRALYDAITAAQNARPTEE